MAFRRCSSLLVLLDTHFRRLRRIICSWSDYVIDWARDLRLRFVQTLHLLVCLLGTSSDLGGVWYDDVR